MPSTAALLSTVGLLASTTLASQPPTAKGKGFSVPAKRVKGQNIGKRQSNNTVTSSDHVVVPFTIGGQEIPVAVDSGATMFWTASTLIDSSETDGLPALYNPNISSTFQVENDSNDATNVCGNEQDSCFMGLDDVSTAGLTAQQMPFGVATTLQSGVFASGQAATMGLGRQPGDPSTWLPRDQPFWYRVGATLGMPYLFAIDLYSDKDGSFDFGYIDETKYTGDISYTSVDTTQNFWNFQMTGYAIGDGEIQTVETFNSLIDTGGPNMGLPAEIVNAYYGSIGGSPSPGNSHTYPCSAYPPPDLTLQLSTGYTMVLNGTYLVEPPDGSGSETCNGRIDDSVQTGYNMGACVFDQMYVVFDHANSQLGFATKSVL